MASPHERPKACKWCGLRILLVRTAASRGKPQRKWTPIDPDPVPGGTITIDAHGDAAVVGPPSLLDGDEPRYRTHFDSCEVYKDRQAARRRPPERADIDG